MKVLIEEKASDNIIGGEIFSDTSLLVLGAVFAILIAVYKMYTSTSGKAKFGNNYAFEWS